MPYARNADLPENVRSVLPAEAQTVFRRVFNATEDEVGEERAFKQAWGALRNQGWRKTPEGRWVKKAQEVQSFVFSTEESPGDVNGGNGWTETAARAWLRDHDLKHSNLDRPESGTQLRFRQFDPARCDGRFQTLTRSFPKGISAVACAVGKAAFSAHFEIRKIDDEQGLVFGWASIAEEDGTLVIDHEGDVIEPEELEKGAYAFVRDARVASDGHDPETIGVGVLVESMFFSKDKQSALGIDVPVGWWVGFQVDDPQLRRSIREEGGHRMFSIGGYGAAEDL